MRRDFGREVIEFHAKDMSLVRHLICGPRHTREEPFLDNLQKMRLPGLSSADACAIRRRTLCGYPAEQPGFRKVFKLERIRGHYNSRLNREGLRTQQINDRKSRGPNCQKDVIEKQRNRLTVSG